MIGEAGHYLVGRRSLAIDEPVGEALHPLANRLKGDGDDGGRHDRQREVGAIARSCQPADADDDANVDRGDEGGKRAVDERAIDHKVDVVKPVAENGDRDADRQQRHKQNEEQIRQEAVVAQKERYGGQNQRKEKPAELMPLKAVAAAVSESNRGYGSDEREQAKRHRQIYERLEGTR